jgi:tRNA/rRNA methyltransferase
MSYEWMNSGMTDTSATPFQKVEQKPATKSQLVGLFDQIEEALDARNYFHPPTKKPRMIDNLRSVLSRPGFTEPEISVLRGVITSLDRFARRWPKGQGPALEAGKGQGDDGRDD